MSDSGSRSTRRTRTDIEALRSGLYDLVSAGHPMTVRQVFYRAVSAGLIDKTEAAYRTVVIRLLSKMRLEGDLPFDWIADGTRWVREPETWDSPGEAVRDVARYYRRAYWRDQPMRIEVWCEKDALTGVLNPITDEYGVPFYVLRGFGSLTYLHQAAAQIHYTGKPTHILYFGDRDPSGLDIERSITDRLTEFLAESSHGRRRPAPMLTVERVAVTPAQMADYDLATRPTKQSDPRAKKFTGESVEVDALHPNILRQLLRDAIEERIERGAWEAMQVAEESERHLLTRWAVEKG